MGAPEDYLRLLIDPQGCLARTPLKNAHVEPVIQPANGCASLGLVFNYRVFMTQSYLPRCTHGTTMHRPGLRLSAESEKGKTRQSYGPSFFLCT